MANTDEVRVALDQQLYPAKRESYAVDIIHYQASAVLGYVVYAAALVVTVPTFAGTLGYLGTWHWDGSSWHEATRIQIDYKLVDQLESRLVSAGISRTAERERRRAAIVDKIQSLKGATNDQN